MRVRVRMLWGPATPPRSHQNGLASLQLGAGFTSVVAWQPALALSIANGGVPTARGQPGRLCPAEHVFVNQKPGRPSRVRDGEVCRATFRPAVVMRRVGGWACPGAVLAS